MIKTTSFSLSRPAHNASASSPRARQQVIKAAKARSVAQPQPDLGSLFAAPTPVPEISAAQARQIIQGNTGKPKSKAKPTSAVPIASAPQPSFQVEIPMPSTSPAPQKTPRTSATAAKIKAAKPVPVPAPAVLFSAPAKVAVPQVEAEPAVEVENAAPQKAAPESKKTRRPRVPTNLAEQYGQSLSKRAENGVETIAEDDSPKKRLSRAERQARRELMTPDDDLLARLHRVHNAIPSAKPEKRPRGWRFDCGRCGQTSFFQTNGAICKCGALAIKE